MTNQRRLLRILNLIGVDIETNHLAPRASMRCGDIVYSKWRSILDWLLSHLCVIRPDNSLLASDPRNLIGMKTLTHLSVDVRIGVSSFCNAAKALLDIHCHISCWQRRYLCHVVYYELFQIRHRNSIAVYRYWDALLFTHLRLDKMAAIPTDDIFRRIFLNEKFCILITKWLKCVPKIPNDNNAVLVYIMAWRRIGDKPLSELMLTRFTDAYMRH